jgi:hypothetical protein
MKPIHKFYGELVSYRRLADYAGHLNRLRSGTPRWRLIKRFHIERQMRQLNLLSLAYGAGWEDRAAGKRYMQPLPRA